ncbi:MAG TPA: SUF system NifU family Fe-S cluster assembly protein [Kofleriaceae bacterium]|nr:SUF system NifU family Fe-S cluster assembly protein [Kofleriaceae bacterium]
MSRSTDLAGDLRELYQEFILDHGKHPRNCRPLEPHTARAEGYNPLCGDRLTLRLLVEGEVIRDIAFEGSGCAISTAAASTMTEAVKGKSLAQARELFGHFHDMLTHHGVEPDVEALGKLAVFAGVAEFPMRVKCATLAWHTLTHALEGGDGPATTE